MRLWVVIYESLKTKKKSSCVILNVFEVAYGSDFLRNSFSLQKFNSQFKLPACRRHLLPLLHAEKIQQKEIGDVCTQAKFKRCLTKVVVTRAGRLWEWSHAEFWLYLEYCVLKSSDTESLTAWRSFTVNGIGQHGLISVNKYFKMEPWKCGINIIISRLSLQPCLSWCSFGILGSTAGTSRNPWLGTEPT